MSEKLQQPTQPASPDGNQSEEKIYTSLKNMGESYNFEKISPGGKSGKIDFFNLLPVKALIILTIPALFAGMAYLFIRGFFVGFSCSFGGSSAPACLVMPITLFISWLVVSVVYVLFVISTIFQWGSLNNKTFFVLSWAGAFIVWAILKLTTSLI